MADQASPECSPPDAVLNTPLDVANDAHRSPALIDQGDIGPAGGFNSLFESPTASAIPDVVPPPPPSFSKKPLSRETTLGVPPNHQYWAVSPTASFNSPEALKQTSNKLQLGRPSVDPNLTLHQNDRHHADQLSAALSSIGFGPTNAEHTIQSLFTFTVPTPVAASQSSHDESPPSSQTVAPPVPGPASAPSPQFTAGSVAPSTPPSSTASPRRSPFTLGKRSRRSEKAKAPAPLREAISDDDADEEDDEEYDEGPRQRAPRKARRAGGTGRRVFPPVTCSWVNPKLGPCNAVIGRKYDMPRHLGKHANEEMELLRRALVTVDECTLHPEYYTIEYGADGKINPVKKGATVCPKCNTTLSREDAVSRHLNTCSGPKRKKQRRTA